MVVFVFGCLQSPVCDKFNANVGSNAFTGTVSQCEIILLPMRSIEYKDWFTVTEVQWQAKELHIFSQIFPWRPWGSIIFWNWTILRNIWPDQDHATLTLRELGEIILHLFWWWVWSNVNVFLMTVPQPHWLRPASRC